MNQNIKNELLFFIKSVSLVIFISGLLSVVSLTFMYGDAVKLDPNKISLALGYHLYWIQALSIMTTAIILQPLEDRKTFRTFIAHSMKIFIYYIIASLFFIAFQYIFILLT